MRSAGLPCPMPLKLKGNVLLLSMIGGGTGGAAPKLKDVVLSAEQLQLCYDQVLLIMKGLWEEARLVHSDLSEYNLLYHHKQVFVIDVAQAVEKQHPMAMHYLQKDCENVNNFFIKRGLNNCMPVSTLLEYVTGVPTLCAESCDTH